MFIELHNMKTQAARFWFFLCIFSLAVGGAGCGNNASQSAIDLVGQAVEENKMGATASDLAAKENPRGEGTFVYLDPSHSFKAYRPAVWLVIDSTAYALNSPSKMITPSLSWSRDADDGTWVKTKINKYAGADEAIKILSLGT